MNAFDSLLEWASEVGEGSWLSWRSACAYLGIGANTAARNLASLGHLEFDWVDNRFGAAPLVAVLTLHSSGCLLLTGSRRRHLREELEMLDDSGDYGVVLESPVPQQLGPETWLVEADLDEMTRFCEDGGFAFEVDSGRRILEAMPRASLEACADEERPSSRFPRKWLDPDAGFYTNVKASKDGLWWVEEYRRDVAFIRREGEWYRLNTREYGPYLAYPDYTFLTYKSDVAELSVDNDAPLPPLLSRAATLQSGRLPRADGRFRHAYVNIDVGLAKLIEEKLGAKMRWL